MKCPLCRRPLFGEADAHFSAGLALLGSLQSDKKSAASIDDAVNSFALCISAAQPYPTGPDGLNRLAAAAKYNVGRCYESGCRDRDPNRAQQNATKAAEAYRTAFEMSHRADSMASCNLASMLLELKRPREAQTWLETTCAINPADSLARVNLAITIMGNGDLVRARAVVQVALERDPDYARAHNASGVIYQRRGMPEEASAAYRRALELDPQLTDASNNLDDLSR